MLEPDFVAAALPLLQAGEVDVLEWSFDIGWSQAAMPEWADELLDHFASKSRLLGHGVKYSLLSADESPARDAWLERLSEECQRRHYRHVSEHFGFMAAGRFHEGAPLPVPLTEFTVRLGQVRLQRLADAARCPIGLENLAFAFGPRDVQDQGRFLEELLTPLGGFLLLDLHNIYCQCCNFDVGGAELLATYPLHRVREIHVSGGSWSSVKFPGPKPLIRRDTHDAAVPQEVFELVRWAIPRCPNLEAVILEQLGGTLSEPNAAEQFRIDFQTLRQVANEVSHDRV